MIEKVFPYSQSEQKLIEKTVRDQNIMINHIVLAQGDSLPGHYSDANVYQVLIRGSITLRLGEEEEHSYAAPAIVQIPYNTRMDISNKGGGPLEFFIVKAPPPEGYQDK